MFTQPSAEQALQRRLATAARILHYYATEPGAVHDRAFYAADELRGVARLLDYLDDLRGNAAREGAPPMMQRETDR